MGKIGFITDSTAYLHPSFIEEHKIKVVSLIVNFEGRVFRRQVFTKILKSFMTDCAR